MEKKVSKVSMEEEFNTLKKHFGGIIATVKALKHTVDILEKRLATKENAEIEEIQIKQKVVEEGIAQNASAIKRIDDEMVKLTDKEEQLKHRNKGIAPSTDRRDIFEEVVVGNHNEKQSKTKPCRYYNRGFCKYRNRCKFLHSNNICAKYLETQKCDFKNCEDRHPKHCKWFNSNVGCRRSMECQYLHVKVAQRELESYKCVGCKEVWTDQTCVVKHVMNHENMYFCLNCDEWIKIKTNVLNEGWSLLDEAGNLRCDI